MREVKGMRLHLDHLYFGVDTDVLWQTVDNDLQHIQHAAAQMLAQVKG